MLAVYVDHSVLVRVASLGQWNVLESWCATHADSARLRISTAHLFETGGFADEDVAVARLEWYAHDMFERVPSSTNAEALELLRAISKRRPSWLSGWPIPATLPRTDVGLWDAVVDDARAFYWVHQSPYDNIAAPTMEGAARTLLELRPMLESGMEFRGLSVDGEDIRFPETDGPYESFWRSEGASSFVDAVVYRVDAVGDMRDALMPYLDLRYIDVAAIAEFFAIVDPGALPISVATAALGREQAMRARKRGVRGSPFDISHFGASLNSAVLLTGDKGFYQSIEALVGNGVLSPRGAIFDMQSENVAYAMSSALGFS